jgi:hypothetical protein
MEPRQCACIQQTDENHVGDLNVVGSRFTLYPKSKVVWPAALLTGRTSTRSAHCCAPRRARDASQGREPSSSSLVQRDIPSLFHRTRWADSVQTFLPAIPLGATDRRALLWLPALLLQPAAAVCRLLLSSPCSSIVHPALSLVQLYRPPRSIIDHAASSSPCQTLSPVQLSSCLRSSCLRSGGTSIHPIAAAPSCRSGGRRVRVRCCSTPARFHWCCPCDCRRRLCQETVERNCPTRRSEETAGRDRESGVGAAAGEREIHRRYCQRIPTDPFVLHRSVRACSL